MPGSQSWSGDISDAEDQAQATCTGCASLCRSSCPVAAAERRETTSPHRLMVQAGLLKRRWLPPSAAGTDPFHCTGCGACEDACQHRVQVPFWLLLTRERALRAGQAPDEVGEAAAAFGVMGNAYGTSLEPALHAALDAASTRTSRHAEEVYLPGCETLHAAPGSATAVTRAMNSLGLGDVRSTSASAHCCGAPLAWAGELEGFRVHASRYARTLEDVRRLVVHDPGCAVTLRFLYRRFGVVLRPAVWTLSGYLVDRVRELRDRWRGPRFHDDCTFAVMMSCHLAYGLGEAESSRVLLNAALGSSWLPLDPSGPGDCCGASGLLPQTAPRTARAMAMHRIRAGRASGAKAIVTLSPRCAAHLRSVDSDFPVHELTELLAEEARA